MVIRALLVLLALLFSFPCEAGIIVRGSGGASCATQSIDQQNTTYNADADTYGNRTRGQSIVAGVTTTVYSIIVYGLGVPAGSNGQLKARFGTSADLSASYLGETDAVDIIYDDNYYEYELIFPSGSRPSQTASNTYYIAVINTGAVYGDRFIIAYQNTDVYGSGIFYYSDTNLWNMGDSVGSWDLYFKTKVCDP